jgi:7-cyano-7-deazaguanine synthase
VTADRAAVLVSGGMDSVAALCWARGVYHELLAVLIDYGQPARDQELFRAALACKDLGVRALRLAIADSLPRGRGLLRRVEDDDCKQEGLSPAFVPGRNAIFAMAAAAHAAVLFPKGCIDVVLGCNAQDARRFPDCRSRATLAMTELASAALARDVVVITPWYTFDKAAILREIKPADRDLVSTTWSCYRAEGPCGRCSACVLRRDAFEAVGWPDRSAQAALAVDWPSCR